MDTNVSAEDALRGILGRPLMISQIAVVCHDLRKTMETYTKLLGWGPWNLYRHEPPRLHDTELHGEPAEYTMLAAEPRVGDMGFELLQPLEGIDLQRVARRARRGPPSRRGHAPRLRGVDRAQAAVRRAGHERPDGRPHRRDDRVLLPRHRAQLKIILESGSGHAIDLVPDGVYP